MTSPPSRHRHRQTARARGFVLPFVLVALGAIGVLALTFATVMWRDDTAVTQTTQAQRLSMTGDEALARAAERWREDSLWTRALHTSAQQIRQIGPHDEQAVVISRSHPLVAWFRATLTHHDPRRSRQVRRELLRPVWLAPPLVELPAALTVVGDVAAADPTLVSGIDLPDIGSPCGPRRDTLSTMAMVADSVVEDALTPWTLRPLAAFTPSLDSLRGSHLLLDAAAHMGQVRAHPASPSPLGTDTSSPPWQLLSLRGTPVHLTGISHYRGLLVIDGPLVLEGSLHLQGLLFVRGTLDAGAGTLIVTGTLVVLGENRPAGAPVARLGRATHVQFDRCRTQMALATVASPRAAPFFLWNVGSP